MTVITDVAERWEIDWFVWWRRRAGEIADDDVLGAGASDLEPWKHASDKL